MKLRCPSCGEVGCTYWLAMAKRREEWKAKM